MPKETTLEILRNFKVHPQKKFGQHFLADELALDRIVDSLNLEKDDLVLEVGAGIGNLTQRLIKKAGLVVAIEVEPAMQAILLTRFQKTENFKLVMQNALRADMNKIANELGLGKKYKNLIITGNIPYSITGNLLRIVSRLDPAPAKVGFLVQNEVAERMMAEPPHQNMLGLSLQVAGKVEKLFEIEHQAFVPPPEVDSALVIWIPNKKRDYKYEEKLLKVAKAGFSQKRKQLHNALQAAWPEKADKVAELLDRAGIEKTRRAETLTITEWERLL